jgi:hypothetical protein
MGMYTPFDRSAPVRAMNDLIGETNAVPYGTCHCGCLRKTTLFKHKDPTTGNVTVQPRRFIHGHNGRKRVRYIEVPTGYLTDCWLWQLAKTQAGYGKCRDTTGKLVMAHRFYYEREHGPIPPDRELDHLCRVRACVNWNHVEPVAGD